MKKLILILLVIASVRGLSQVNINLQLPPSGLSLKSQLWNMIVSNSSGTAMEVYAEMRLTEVTTNRQVMNATTNYITLAPGNQFLQYGSWTPVQYNIIDPSYQGFVGTEFLPVGRFVACYSLFKYDGHGSEKIFDDCEVIEVEPLSPPQLVYPADKDSIETNNPVFNWISPAPVNLFTSLTYDLEMAEVYPGQTVADAIQLNIPLFIQPGIGTTNYPYPAGATQLEVGKKYAWRILAKNNEAIVGKSETWLFMLKNPAIPGKYVNDQPFARLKKDNQLSYAIAENQLKFEYINETQDTTWNINVFDISVPGRKKIEVSFDSVSLRTGQNMVKINTEQMQAFTDKHIYLLQLRNSREELWQLKFEYRRKL